MRLICPNCGAQYEVDDDVIPAAGRDVQCSNCGHTWFQRSTGQDRQMAEDRPDEDQQTEPLDDEDEDEAAERQHDDLSDEEFEEEADGALERDLTRRELDPSVAGILREEAEREKAEREHDPVGLETQTELGLDSGADDARHDDDTPDDQSTPSAEIEEDEGEMTVSAVVAASARRDLLPDIEEINSTLTATSDRDEADPDEREEERAKSGFRRGFIIAVLFFAVLALIYAYAPRIVEAVPALEPVLSSYVAAVNALRLWVDGLMQSAVEKLTALLGQVSGNQS